jgi:hypothetical protein
VVAAVPGLIQWRTKSTGGEPVSLESKELFVAAKDAPFRGMAVSRIQARHPYCVFPVLVSTITLLWARGRLTWVTPLQPTMMAVAAGKTIMELSIRGTLRRYTSSSIVVRMDSPYKMYERIRY